MGMAMVGHVTEGEFKRWLHHQVYTVSFQILGGALSAVITYHNTENRPRQGICVANHTSPIDVVVLACDNAYALVSQTRCRRKFMSFKILKSFFKTPLQD